jgi:hypothetical protein
MPTRIEMPKRESRGEAWVGGVIGGAAVLIAGAAWLALAAQLSSGWTSVLATVAATTTYIALLFAVDLAFRSARHPIRTRLSTVMLVVFAGAGAGIVHAALRPAAEEPARSVVVGCTLVLTHALITRWFSRTPHSASE